MMRVGLDVTALDHEMISGVGIYVKHLAYQLTRSPRVQVQGLWRTSRWRNRHWIRQHTTLPLSPFVEFGPWIWPSNFQLFHGPDFRVPRDTRIARVVTIHDLAFFDSGMTSPRFAKQRRELLHKTLVVDRPQRIIAVSDCTRRRLVEKFPELIDRVRVVHLGADHLGPKLKPTQAIYPFPYFLFVGNLEARKNVVGLIKAFDVFAGRAGNDDHRLVLVGKPGFDYESIEKALASARHKSRIILPGFVSNTELSALYAHAVAFVLPSFQEGFGIPVLEAMGAHCAVITSQGTSTEEIAGAAARLVNPHDLESIVAGLEDVARDEVLRRSLIERGQVRFGDFRWRQCAEQTIDVYQEAVG